MTAADNRRHQPRNQGGLAYINAPERRSGVWAEHALCRDPDVLAAGNVELDDFFPEFAIGKTSPHIEASYARAKAICAGCPVAWPCLIEHRHELWGVWGGTTPQERDVLKQPNHGWVGPKPGNPLARNAGGPRNARATG